MILGVYAIRDCVAGTYLPPSYAHNESEMIRAIKYELTKPGMMQQFAGDYVLYKIGEYDDDMGVLIPCDPVIVARLGDLTKEVDTDAPLIV